MFWKDKELEEALAANRKSHECVKDAIKGDLVMERLSGAFKKMGSDTDDVLKDVVGG
ncbi:MAG: hypothetical protein O2912_02260 [Proteobacteria bacterium]|nr:hypothetical protein [Pseudomonadota bacterium]